MNQSTEYQLPWKSAWITGAGKGIGEALAVLLCQHGVDVIASSRTPEDLQQLEQRCRSYPGNVIKAPLDITDPEQIAALTGQWSPSNAPDLVVLNAGTHDPFAAQAFNADRCLQLLRTNLHGTIHCLDPVLKLFLARGSGQLAVVSSLAGYRGLPTAAAYGASKAALINLCEALYLDLKNSGIKLQLINPGFVRTPLTDKNEFTMPALMEVEDAAQRMLKGLQSSHFEIVFPRRFAYALKLLRILPYRWYLGLIGKSVKTEQTLEGEKRHG